MKKCGFLSIFFLFLCPVILTAQSTAQEIETLLNANTVSYGQDVRFILNASERMIASSANEAFRYARLQNLLPLVPVNSPARLDIISYLIMRAFDLKGGVMYSITKSPHYAYRELVYLEVIQGETTPSMNISGEQLLFITGRILEMREQ
jgi:hypothetical protein